MDLDDIRRKRMRLFSPTNDADLPTTTTPTSYCNNDGTATFPIDLTGPSSLQPSSAAEPSATPSLIDLTGSMDFDESLASDDYLASQQQLKGNGSHVPQSHPAEGVSPIGAYKPPPKKKSRFHNPSDIRNKLEVSFCLLFCYPYHFDL